MFGAFDVKCGHRLSGLILTCNDSQNVQWWIEMWSDERL